MPNVKNVISRHNRKILGRSEATKPATSCNCRNQDECPLDNKCQAESIVYKAVVTSLDDGLKKEYIGMKDTATIRNLLILFGMRKKLNCRSIYGNLNLKRRLLPSIGLF